MCRENCPEIQNCFFVFCFLFLFKLLLLFIYLFSYLFLLSQGHYKLHDWLRAISHHQIIIHVDMMPSIKPYK